MTEATGRQHWFTAADGTRLFSTDHGPLDAAATALLCLPGLTRHGGDFEPVVDNFSTNRRVVTMDFRGRGKSAWAADPHTYRPEVELQDTLAFLAHLGINRVALLGTSRGGIVGLLMAAMGKHALAGLLLNDVGCMLEREGLLRITSYVGHPRCHDSWAAAAKAFASTSAGFAALTDREWERVVRRIYAETDNGICPRHDPRLALTLPSDDDIRNGKVAESWALLPALADIPFALLRGEGSDLLSEATVTRMAVEAPGLVTTTVPGRGHVPFLDEAESTSAIAAWLQRVDEMEKGR